MSSLPFPLFNRGVHFLKKTPLPFHVFVGFFHWIGENYWIWRGNILFSEIEKSVLLKFHFKIYHGTSKICNCDSEKHTPLYIHPCTYTPVHTPLYIHPCCLVGQLLNESQSLKRQRSNVKSTWDYTSVPTLSGLTRALLTLIWWSMLDPFIFVIPAGFDNQGYRRELKLIRKTASNTQVFRFSNCKSAVQSKLGPQRLAQLGYSNVHRLYVKMEIQSNTKVLTSVCTCLWLW